MLGFVKALISDSIVVKNQYYPLINIENNKVLFIAHNEECEVSIFDKNFEIFLEKT